MPEYEFFIYLLAYISTVKIHAMKRFFLSEQIFTKYKLPYLSITPTFSICPSHGYLSGEHFECPKCVIKQPCEVYSRVVGYYRPVSQWNRGKQEEFQDTGPVRTPRRRSSGRSAFQTTPKHTPGMNTLVNIVHQISSDIPQSKTPSLIPEFGVNPPKSRSRDLLFPRPAAAPRRPKHLQLLFQNLVNVPETSIPRNL